MHDLSDELQSLQVDDASRAARDQALRLERREVSSVRPELMLVLYVAVALLVGGVGLLVKENLHRIGPAALLAGLVAASAVCYLVAEKVRRSGRERSLPLDYVLLLGALLASSAVAYAEVQFHPFGAGWSRHLLLLALWHVLTAYHFSSRLVLAAGLASFAGWLGVEPRLGTLFEPMHPWLRAGPRSLLCAALFWLGTRAHRDGGVRGSFHEVYLQFALHFGFWGALALGGDSGTRWIGAVLLGVLAWRVGRAGIDGRRQSLLLFAVGYATIGLVWLESLLIRDYLVTSWAGMLTVVGAVVLLMRLRARLQESTE